MKKKIFSSLLLVAFALVSMSTFVSCKDYDDDINANATAITSLQEQLKALQTALDQAKADASAAHAQYATLTQLNEAKAAVEAAAKEAAAKAKAEALSEAVEQCKTLIAGKADQKDLDALATKVTSIDEALNKLPKNIATVDYVDAALKNLEAQIKALDYLKTLIPEGTKIGDGSAADIVKLQNELNAVKEELAKKGSSADIETVQTAMAKATQAVSDLSANVDIISVLVQKTLTSITLVPNLYVGGIEAIEFKRFRYYPMEYVNGAWERPEVLANRVEIDDVPALATYQLNPTNVKMESLKDIDVVTNVAAVRAGKPILSVAGADFQEGGKLVVALQHNFLNTKHDGFDSLNLGNSKTYITALKITRENGVDENNAQTYTDIYSEYAKIATLDVVPRIGHINNYKKGLHEGNDNLLHFSDSTTIYASDPYKMLNIPEDLQLDYKKAWNLNDFVTGCDKNHEVEIEKAELARFGLKFRFAIAEGEYVEKNVPVGADKVKFNEQNFAKIEDGKTIASIVPDVEGSSNNAACVGKTPVVRIELVDTVKNKVVDVRYTKVKWIEGHDVAVLKADVNTKVILNGCNMTTKLTWTDFIAIYSRGAEAADGSSLSLESISEEEFKAVYLTKSPTYEGVNFPRTGKLVHDSGSATGTDFLYWTIYDADVDTIVGTSKTLIIQVTFHSSSATRPDLIMTWSVDVLRDPSITKAGDNSFWKGETIIVTPMTLNEAGWDNTNGVTVNYKKDLMEYFVWVPYRDDANNLDIWSLIQGMHNPCTSNLWDMQFDIAQNVTAKVADDDIRNYTVGYYDTQYDKGEPWTATYDGKQYSLAMLSKGATKVKYNYGGSYSSDEIETIKLDWQDGLGNVRTPWATFTYTKPIANLQNVDYPAYDSKYVALESLFNGFDNGFKLGSVKYKNLEKVTNMTVWARYNDKNIVPAGKFNVALVKPLDLYLTMKDKTKPYKVMSFYLDNHENSNTQTVTYDVIAVDFLGERVASVSTEANGTAANTKHSADLYKYYACQDMEWNFDDDKIRFCYVDGTSSIDNKLEYDDAMTVTDVKKSMPGKWGNLSITADNRNNPTKITVSGFNSYTLDQQIRFYIPVTMKYKFGTVKIYAEFYIAKATSQSAPAHN